MARGALPCSLLRPFGHSVVSHSIYKVDLVGGVDIVDNSLTPDA